MFSEKQRTELEEIQKELYAGLLELARIYDRRLYNACRVYDIVEEAELELRVIPSVLEVPIESVISRSDQRINHGNALKVEP